MTDHAPAKGGMGDTILKGGVGLLIGVIGVIMLVTFINNGGKMPAADTSSSLGGGNGGFNTAHTGGMPSWMDGKPFVPHGGKPPAAPSGYHWNPFSQPQPTADTGCNKGELRFNPSTGRMQACGPL